MQLLKGWFDENGCEEMTTEKDTMMGKVMKYKAGVLKAVKTKGAFPIFCQSTGWQFDSTMESVLCQLSDFFCD